ncbi:hypothetical protein F5Y12DRAFT_719743 [Xylaria sp. FL1777]|nr:hypothetical protein F5Y12DRAFT_719743 [Xylaria sp. FL1777]
MAHPTPPTGLPNNTILNSTQEVQNLELDFSPDNTNFIRARDDGTMYWSTSHKELSHPNLFARAARTRNRLIPDLKKTLIKLSVSKKRWIRTQGKLFDLEPPESRFELRLTGHAYANTTTRILMTGWVWVQCSDTYSMRKIKERLAELTWLESHRYAPVHVYLEPIVVAHSDSELDADVYDYRTGVKLGGEFQLHVDIALNGEGDSLCGRVCRSRITLQSRVVNESFSRVGGVLRLNDSVDALITTAHGILNYFLVEVLPLLEAPDVAENQLDSSDETSDESSDEGDMGDISSQEQRGGADPDRSHTDTLGYIDTSQLQQWEPLRPFDTITYIGQAEQTDTDMVWNLLFRNFDADYALFRQSELHSSQNTPQNNVYVVDSNDSDAELDSISSKDSQISSPVSSEATYLLLGVQEAIPVELFPDEVEISMLGAKFKTLKLRAPKILSRGTSGSWVVRGEKLCGVIIALYPFESYALMLPAMTVSRDLTEFGVNIEAVSLPPTDSRLVSGGVGGAQPKRRIVSMFENSSMPSTEASSPTHSETAATILYGSASHDTPLSSHLLHKYQEELGAHPGTLVNLMPDPSHVHVISQATSIGTSRAVLTSGQVSGSRKISQKEAAELQKARLAIFFTGSTGTAPLDRFFNNGFPSTAATPLPRASS